MPPWTQSRRDEALSLLQRGFSRDQIATKLGSSRGAVSIQINTALGLKREQPKSTDERRNKPAAATPASKAVHNARESDIALREDRVRFVDLETNACRWPIGGHPGVDPDFGFCGKPKFRGVSGHKMFGLSCYCLEHLRKSLAPRGLRLLDEVLEKTAGGMRSP